ncbi:MAG: aldo/keto reductase [Acidobacteriales bacterium]|nr:aldo/keto reductase [Terriglobales bacterium]
METTKVGGVQVSRVGLGTWAIGGSEWGAVPEDAAIATILGAVERGINLIDTAPIYGRGRAEDLIGKAMRARLRHELEAACVGWGPPTSIFTRCIGRIR